jgi:hypothetical protein
MKNSSDTTHHHTICTQHSCVNIYRNTYLKALKYKHTKQGVQISVTISFIMYVDCICNNVPVIVTLSKLEIEDTLIVKIITISALTFKGLGWYLNYCMWSMKKVLF